MKKDYSLIWSSVITKLGKETSASSVGIWFDDSYIVLIDNQRAVICIATQFKIDTITRKYSELLRKLLENELGYPVDPVLILPGSVKNYSDVSSGEADESKVFKKGSAGLLNLSNFIFEYTFENFIVGTSNQFAHAACTAVARNPATDYNPLFIYSASGLGKTHLLNAIMNEISKRDPKCAIIYVKGEEFTNQMIEAIRSGSQSSFRERYRKADVLLIDDIQFIAGKESTQEEFFHTFNALYESHKQIIMTSDRPPKDIKTLEDRLKTRFEWGLIADIQPPDYELRIAIMKKKARMMGVTLPDNVLTFIAENLKTNIREIEGAVKRICAMAFLSSEPISLETAKNCMSAFMTTAEAPTVTADRIIDRVSKKYGVSVEDIYGRKRTKHIAYARSVSIYIIRKITDMSFPTIGKLFERDHSTIINSNQMIIDELKNNPLLSIEISDLIREITE